MGFLKVKIDPTYNQSMATAFFMAKEKENSVRINQNIMKL